MKVLIVYAHPSRDSLTYAALCAFEKGLEDAGHTFCVSDLYEMGFKTDMSEAEYLRESNYRLDVAPPPDVLAEQAKILAADALAFIYPLFWTEAPAKLVGWFDRVWTYGFAYGDGRGMKQLKKALFIVSAGNSMEYLIDTGLHDSMCRVMLNDRINDRAVVKKMVVLDETTKQDMKKREQKWAMHMRAAYVEGFSF